MNDLEPRDAIFDPEVDTITFDAQIPNDYAQILEKEAPGVTQIVQQTQLPGENWYDSLAKLLPALTATYQQKQILDVQVERAKQGLPPLNATQFSAGVNVGIAPETQKMLMYGAIGLGAIFLLTALMKR